MTSESAGNELHPHAASLKNPDGTWRYTNRLIDQTSPYLLQHAHNPVEWWPWGREAFEEARQRGVPIFLSVGYATCYWCHVMERQVFEDPTIAEQMNARFVCIKVDREERPDVDEVYMTATQLMTRSGGWPMSVFLTPPGAAGEDDPGLKPFWAGTYIPPTPQFGRPGFPQVLDAISEAWQSQREDVLDQADRLAQAVSETLARQHEPGPVDASLVQAATDQVLSLYDREHGGFGGAPKFPQPAYLHFLLQVYVNNPADALWHVIGHTLDRMSRGGVYDQVGGGFHRYSTDEGWLVPHFEKMLYDNAQLVEVYARAIELKPTDGNAALYERVVRETCGYVMREMTDPTGAFWSAQDAEVNAREGGSYIWTESQVREALGDDQMSDLAIQMYGLADGPNFQDPHHEDAAPANVLYLPKPLAQVSAETGIGMAELLRRREAINARLKAVRDLRDQPLTDDKVLTSWNGMMIAALADAGRVLNEPAYVRAAERAADAILSHMVTEDGGLYHTMRQGKVKVPGFLEDYAWLVHGLLALHRAEPDNARWLDQATRLTRSAIERFGAEHGGYYDTLADQPDLFVRVRSTYDGAIPSANGRMIHNLLTLYQRTGVDAWLDRAVIDLKSFSEPLRQSGAGMVQTQGALLRALEMAPRRFADQAVHRDESSEEKDPGAVKADVEVAGIDPDRGEIIFNLVLDIADGFHINSHTPTESWLIPTEISLAEMDGYELKAEYPEPEVATFTYADTALSVYEGRVRVRGVLRRLPDATGPMPLTIPLRLRYQACTDTACLPPVVDRLELTLIDPAE